MYTRNTESLFFLQQLLNLLVIIFSLFIIVLSQYLLNLGLNNSRYIGVKFIVFCQHTYLGLEFMSLILFLHKLLLFILDKVLFVLEIFPALGGRARLFDSQQHIYISAVILVFVNCVFGLKRLAHHNGESSSFLFHAEHAFVWR